MASLNLNCYPIQYNILLFSALSTHFPTLPFNTEKAKVTGLFVLIAVHYILEYPVTKSLQFKCIFFCRTAE